MNFLIRVLVGVLIYIAAYILAKDNIPGFETTTWLVGYLVGIAVVAVMDIIAAFDRPYR